MASDNDVDNYKNVGEKNKQNECTGLLRNMVKEWVSVKWVYYFRLEGVQGVGK